MSNSTLLTAYRHGVPSVKVRVGALTAESYNTISKPGVYSTTRAPIPATPTEIPASGQLLKDRQYLLPRHRYIRVQIQEAYRSSVSISTTRSIQHPCQFLR